VFKTASAPASSDPRLPPNESFFFVTRTFCVGSFLLLRCTLHRIITSHNTQRTPPNVIKVFPIPYQYQQHHGGIKFTTSSRTNHTKGRCVHDKVSENHYERYGGIIFSRSTVARLRELLQNFQSDSRKKETSEFTNRRPCHPIITVASMINKACNDHLRHDDGYKFNHPK
jgi:hypothetical protein